MNYMVEIDACVKEGAWLLGKAIQALGVVYTDPSLLAPPCEPRKSLKSRWGIATQTDEFCFCDLTLLVNGLTTDTTNLSQF